MDVHWRLSSACLLSQLLSPWQECPCGLPQELVFSCGLTSSWEQLLWLAPFVHIFCLSRLEHPPFAVPSCSYQPLVYTPLSMLAYVTMSFIISGVCKWFHRALPPVIRYSQMEQGDVCWRRNGPGGWGRQKELSVLAWKEGEDNHGQIWMTEQPRRVTETTKVRGETTPSAVGLVKCKEKAARCFEPQEVLWGWRSHMNASFLERVNQDGVLDWGSWMNRHEVTPNVMATE